MAPARVRRTGRRALRRGSAAGPSGSRLLPVRGACRRGWSRRCRARCGVRSVVRVSAAASRRRRRTSRLARRATRCPTLLIHPPRLVLELTSGLTVTMRLPSSGAARLMSTSARPRAVCVLPMPDGVRPRSVGTGLVGTGPSVSRRSRVPARRHRSASGEPSEKACQGWAGSTPSRAASSASCGALSNAEWFCGCPSVGSR
jgi:hypothetical protein